MKLGIVTAYPPSKVTLNEYAYHLVKHFRQNKSISEIVLYTDVSQEEAHIDQNIDGCKVTVVNCWKFNSYKNLLTIKNAIAQTKPDGVFYNLQFMKFGDKKVPAALGLLSPWLTKRSGIATIVLLHNIMETVDLDSAGFTKNPLKRRVYNFIGRVLTKFILKADKVAFTISQYVQIIEGKYLANNTMLIPHGTFETPEEPDYDKQNDFIKVMTFGKFGTYKKVEILIEAVEAARNEVNTPIALVIAGTDNPNALGYLDMVQSKYKHIKNVEFTGYVQEEEVPELFSSSDMVVFPYTSTTGSSGVLHQAGSYGKAVIMPDLGDLSLLVKDEGYRGEFFEATSVQSLKEAIVKLSVDQNHRTSLAKANYKAAGALSMEHIANLYVQQFERLNEKKRAVKLIAI
ncbi:MAG: glycosyltransferase [Gilvibacter sp.]